MRGYRTGTGKKKFRVLLLLVLMLTLCVSSAVPAAAESLSSEQPRQLQADILEWKRAAEGNDQILSGALLDGAGGASSDWIAFNISRIGIEDNQAAYLSRLRDAVEKIYQNMEDSLKRYRVSDMHRIAMTVKACGGDPTNFGTDPEGNPINLIQDTVWNSLWGDPGSQGINGYIWALLTVDSMQYEEPEGAEWTREALVTAILSRQLADGGFGLIKTDPSDVDLTSMSLTALAPYGNSDKAYTYESIVTGEQVTATVDEVAEKAFACLTALQADDGTMLTYQERTSESTAWAMMALASWGRDPEEDQLFIKNGKTLLDGIEAFRLEDGGIVHSLDGQEEETVGNNMAGYQAVYGLEAVCRLREDKGRVFDLTDASTVSEEEIEAAKASLPELTEEDEKTGEEVQEDTGRRMVYMTAVIAAAVVLVVAIFLILVLKDRTKKKNLSDKDGSSTSGSSSDGSGDSDWDDDEDDEW
ncbi:hypothetical protein [Fusibacillus kribbianus]|uniref:Surface/cell-adhesion protein n=1 Tax=Fusibacillus kribbianus TaxID=3044208 RepID=A0AAP4BB44_9FIRM|nr:hypothetical protein [Ruminococcus sp. YH-rum2234]MDI9241281.1 hypothetical protein [Ruminococcus sp. YH-rum2234]